MSDAIRVRKLNKEGSSILFIGIGGIGFQVSMEKAEFLCRLLADFTDLQVVKKHKLKRFDNEKKRD